MSSGHNDPRLLYAINGVQAYHVANGKEEPLTTSGPQTLSLLMVPTSSPFADVSHADAPQEDFYLHLHLPPELDLPLPATTQIYHQPPVSYLIPRWDLGPDNGAFTRLEFPAVGSRQGVQEDVDTFETILAQCTAFLERSPPPKPALKKTASMSSKAKLAAADELPAYNPAAFKPGEAYATGSPSLQPGGKIVLVDEEDGSVIGELTDGYHVVEDTAIQPGSKDPVEITLPADGSQAVRVQPASREYVEMVMHPSYKQSTLVSGASKASRLIVTSSDLIAKGLQTGADNFSTKTKPVAKPVTFTPATHDRIRRINQFSEKAVGLSAHTVGHINKVAQNLGASLTRRKDGGGKGYDKDGNLIDTYKPGLLNKSLMAFNTVADGIEQAAHNLLVGTSSSMSQVVQHRWGDDAGQAARNLGGGFKNVGLVYIDVTGVSRRAILKSVAKGMVVGRVGKSGDNIIVGGGDGGAVVLASDYKQDPSATATPTDTASLVSAYDAKEKQTPARFS